MTTSKHSAGMLIYKTIDHTLNILLAHPGGPFFASKDKGCWSIFKGEIDEGETTLIAAKREFCEETGQAFPKGELHELLPVTRSGGRKVYAWAIEAEYDATHIVSNNFTMIWPPKSGTAQEFPENDRAEWFSVEVALEKVHPVQSGLIRELHGWLMITRPELKLPQLTDSPSQITLL